MEAKHLVPRWVFVITTISKSNGDASQWTGWWRAPI